MAQQKLQAFGGPTDQDEGRTVVEEEQGRLRRLLLLLEELPRPLLQELVALQQLAPFLAGTSFVRLADQERVVF